MTDLQELSPIQASSVLLEGGSLVLEDGLLTCDMKLLLDNVVLVSNDTKFMVRLGEIKESLINCRHSMVSRFTILKLIPTICCLPEEVRIPSVSCRSVLPHLTSFCCQLKYAATSFRVCLALEKDIHSMNDNAQFPWMSQEMVGIVRVGIEQADKHSTARLQQIQITS